MRQGQQNRRGRGRQNNGGHNSNQHNQHNQSNINNNRKGQNPLARSYESNGPDVKIRGNPAHIAEKYTTLARDAHSSGDSVLAEAYLQYAEHYNRIIMAYREQQQQSGEGQYRPRTAGEAGEGGGEPLSGDDDGDDQSSGIDGSIRGQEPQPGMFDAPNNRFADRQLDQPVREDRGQRDDRPQRGYDDRQPRRNDGNRNDGNRSEGNRPEGGQREGGQREGSQREGSQREGGQRDGGRRDRYGEGQRGYNVNRDDRRERLDRNQGQDRSSGDRPNQERSYQERQGQNRPAQDRPHDRDRSGQERSSQDRPAFDRPTQDRVQGDANPVKVDLEAAPMAPVRDESAPAHDVSFAIDAAPAHVAEPVAVTREAPAPRRRAAAAPSPDRFAEGVQEQPEFLRRPVRRPKREAAAPAIETGDVPPDAPSGKSDE